MTSRCPELFDNDDVYHYAKGKGRRLAYRRTGSGEPILLLHGVASYSFLWRPIIERLQNNFDLIAPDLLGCGNSEKPDGADYSIAAQATYMIGLMDSLGIERFHLVGHDMGGGVAQIITVRHPERLFSLSLVNSVGYDYWPVQPITTMRTPVIRHLAQSVFIRSMMKLVVRHALFHKERLTDEVMDELWQPFHSYSGRTGFFNVLKAINNRLLLDITEDLKQIDMPVLLIRGDADAYLSRKICDRLAQDIPNARLELVPQGGHFIQLDEPDAVSALLTDFINTVGASDNVEN